MSKTKIGSHTLGVVAPTKEPVFTVDNVIHTETDYTKFKNLSFNRLLNERNIVKLIHSINTYGNLTSIIVNVYGEIIDGQHRFEALKRLNMPIRYSVIGNVSNRDILSSLQVSQRWQNEDWLNTWQHIESYSIFKAFQEEWDLNVVEMYRLFKISKSELVNGTMTISQEDLTKATAFMNNVSELVFPPSTRKYKWGSRDFILALIQTIKESSNWDWDHFIDQFNEHCTRYYHVSMDAEGMREAIENIYNHSQRASRRLKF